MTIGNCEQLFTANFCFSFYVHQISLKSKVKNSTENEKIILGLELQMRGVQINKNCITWSRVHCLCTGHFTNLTPCFGEVKYLLIFYQRPAPLPSQQNPNFLGGVTLEEPPFAPSPHSTP